MDDPHDLPDTGSVLLVGVYADLRADAVQHTLDAAHATGRPLSLLTGRDVHSLSWMAAKQYARVTPDAPVGVLSELDTAAPAPQADVWLGAADVHRLDVRQIALGQVWRRVLFHGNGKDDQLNLGQFTLCGASPAAAAPGMPGPRCAYGLGCTKPQDKLIPARGIRAAELVLANCFSGALATTRCTTRSTSSSSTRSTDPRRPSSPHSPPATDNDRRTWPGSPPPRTPAAPPSP
ncbi:hypothetical protein ACFQ51_50355 [Streptomyces kaempferi]